VWRAAQGSLLAPAFALLGRNFKSVWPVLLPLCGQLSLLAVSWRLTLTCHHWEVDKLGKRKTGQGRSVKPLSIKSWPQGWRLWSICSVPSSPPSPTDDHRPPAPTVVAEVMCGERRREAFGTCVRVAGS
jgi:hypothetical protein